MYHRQFRYMDNDFLDTLTRLAKNRANCLLSMILQDRRKIIEGAVCKTEIGNKIYYIAKSERGNLDIFSRTSCWMNEWRTPLQVVSMLPAANYPIGWSHRLLRQRWRRTGYYDIFVTRYSTNTDTYVPENIGYAVQLAAINDYVRHWWIQQSPDDFAFRPFQPEGKGMQLYVSFLTLPTDL